jgi:hypothetical protein
VDFRRARQLVNAEGTRQSAPDIIRACGHYCADAARSAFQFPEAAKHLSDGERDSWTARVVSAILFGSLHSRRRWRQLADDILLGEDECFIAIVPPIGALFSDNATKHGQPSEWWLSVVRPGWGDWAEYVRRTRPQQTLLSMISDVLLELGSLVAFVWIRNSSNMEIGGAQIPSSGSSTLNAANATSSEPETAMFDRTMLLERLFFDYNILLIPTMVLLTCRSYVFISHILLGRQSTLLEIFLPSKPPSQDQDLQLDDLDGAGLVSVDRMTQLTLGSFVAPLRMCFQIFILPAIVLSIGAYRVFCISMLANHCMWSDWGMLLVTLLLFPLFFFVPAMMVNTHCRNLSKAVIAGLKYTGIWWLWENIKAGYRFSCMPVIALWQMVEVYTTRIPVVSKRWDAMVQSEVMKDLCSTLERNTRDKLTKQKQRGCCRGWNRGKSDKEELLLHYLLSPCDRKLTKEICQILDSQLQTAKQRDVKYRKVSLLFIYYYYYYYFIFSQLFLLALTFLRYHIKSLYCYRQLFRSQFDVSIRLKRLVGYFW